MKLLLDECIDRRLAREFAGYRSENGFSNGMGRSKNGQLLTLAQAEFDVFITVDRNLPFQQNLPQFDIAIIVLQAASNRLSDLKILVPRVLAALSTAVKGQATVVI